MADESRTNVRGRLQAITKQAVQYFIDAEEVVEEPEYKKDVEPFFFGSATAEHYWNQLPPELQETASKIVDELLPICAFIADFARSSPLTGTEDVRDIKSSAKKMRAALRLREYDYRDADVVHDEGTVLGFKPARQSEAFGLSPTKAEPVFLESAESRSAVLKLLEASPNRVASESPNGLSEASKYKAGTAFVMMWMDPKQPELDDVLDTVRGVLKSFGIRAVRADDIEHEGLIADRIINEIRTSEFLFADLTGARPNVYYEVGYAHALRKRVILFRKSGTGLGFDLAGYNCPEYDNLRDLRDKLEKRLVSITNRNPTSDEGI